MKRAILFLAAAIVVSAPAAVFVDPVAYSAAAVTDSKFITTAGVAGAFEVESSRLAADRSQNADIKSFAQRMISDHNAAGKELETAVKAGGEKTPVPQDLDAKHKQMMEKLTKAKSDQFDKLYIKMQVQAHKDAVELFGNYAKSGHNETLRSFAQKTLPTLEDHYKQIKSISGQS